MKNPNSELFEDLIHQIRSAVPVLEMTESMEVPEFVSAQYFWPDQPGLNTELAVSLQNDDEVHLCIGREFWAEFRPVSDSDVRDEVFDRVIGFASGEYRIRAEYLGDRLERVTMQRPMEDESWVDIEKSIIVGKTGWFWNDRSVKIIRNREQVADGDAEEAV